MTSPSHPGGPEPLEELAVELLYDLVSIPSPSGQEAEAVEHLVGWMADQGFEAEVDSSGSAVGVRGRGPRDVVLLGHIDTVPGDLPVYMDGSKMYGRGTVDAKGPLAAFAAAAAGLDLPPGLRLVVIGATEEENHTSRGAYHARDRYDPCACLIGEPSGWDRITLGYRGRMTVDWSYRGPLAHSATPLPSPAQVAAEIWESLREGLEEANRGSETEFNRIRASLEEINGRIEGAYGRADMRLSLRLPPSAEAREVEEILRAQIIVGDLEILGLEEAFVAGKHNALVRSLLGAIRDAGSRPRFVHKTGSSDMNVVGPAWDCPIAAYGPGDSRLDHTPDEHIDLEEFRRSIKVLRRALRTLIDEIATDSVLAEEQKPSS